jgi:hypothetical protein
MRRLQPSPLVPAPWTARAWRAALGVALALGLGLLPHAADTCSPGRAVANSTPPDGKGDANPGMATGGEGIGTLPTFWGGLPEGVQMPEGLDPQDKYEPGFVLTGPEVLVRRLIRSASGSGFASISRGAHPANFVVRFHGNVIVHLDESWEKTPEVHVGVATDITQGVYLGSVTTSGDFGPLSIVSSAVMELDLGRVLGSGAIELLLLQLSNLHQFRLSVVDHPGGPLLVQKQL